MMADVITVTDLEETKKHNTFHVDVITGRTGDYATNAVTGQVQKTLPATINGIDWSYVGKFADGVTFTKKSDFAIDSDGVQWIYAGSDPFPKTVPPATVPSEPTYQAVHVKSASAISNANGGSVQDFIDETDLYIPKPTIKKTVIADTRYGVAPTNTAAANGAIITTLLEQYKEVVIAEDIPLEGVVIKNTFNKLRGLGFITASIQTPGASCISFIRGAINCSLIGIAITCYAENSTAIDINGDIGTGSQPQYLNFYDVFTEGNKTATECWEGTTSLKIKNSWSNNFYSCRFNRTKDGVIFGESGGAANSVNANYFYGCEVRSVNSYINGGSPVIHRTGDCNSFIGGIIENWRKPIIMEGGFLTISKVYVEAFYSASAFSLYSGKLLIDGCHRPGVVFIFGESTLIYKNNNCKTTAATYSFPSIQRYGDINAKIIVSGNDTPDGKVLIRPRQHKNLTTGAWELSTKGTESIDDIQSRFSLHAVKDTPSVTGDSSYGVVTYGNNSTQGIYYDDAGETNPQTGVFTPKQSGIYSISASVNLSGVTAGQTVTLKVAVSGRNMEYFLYAGSATPTGSGSMIVSGNCQCELIYGDSVNIQVYAEGSSKDVGVLRGDATNGYTVFSAIRLK